MVFSLKPILKEQKSWQQELESVVKSLKSKKNVLIVGHEKLGKSSFLLSLHARLAQQKSFVPVLLSSERCIDLFSYVKNNLANILSCFSQSLGSSGASDIFSLSVIEIDNRISGMKISDEAKQHLKLLLFFGHDPKITIESVLSSFFELPELLAKESKSTCVFIIDDVDRLRDLKHEAVSGNFFFEWLNSKQSRDSLFVLSSSIKMELSGFDELELKPLALESAREFFIESGLKLSEPALSAIYNITEGVPFYLNFMARLVSKTSANDVVAINSLFDDALSNELNMCFSEKLKLLSPKELPILICMAEHKVNTPSRISKLLNYSQTNVRRFLSIMEEKGFVTLKERGVFEIHDPVFRRWLETNSRR